MSGRAIENKPRPFLTRVPTQPGVRVLHRVGAALCLCGVVVMAAAYGALALSLQATFFMAQSGVLHALRVEGLQPPLALRYSTAGLGMGAKDIVGRPALVLGDIDAAADF